MPRLSVNPEGVITAIYSDELQALNAQGKVAISRASDVEPTINGKWIASIRQDGAELGPFDYRADALAAEIEYLEKIFSLTDES